MDVWFFFHKSISNIHVFYRFERHQTIAFIYKTFFMELKKAMLLSYSIKVM